jgi:hypothetical protein
MRLKKKGQLTTTLGRKQLIAHLRGKTGEELRL